MCENAVRHSARCDSNALKKETGSDQKCKEERCKALLRFRGVVQEILQQRRSLSRTDLDFFSVIS